MNNHKEFLKGKDLIEPLLSKSGMRIDDIQKVAGCFKPLFLKKGETFIPVDKRSDKIGLLISGLLVAKYEKTDSVDEIVSRFYYSPKNIIVASFESFYLETVTNEKIEALEDSFIMFITRSELNRLYDDIPELNRIGREMAQQSYIQALQRIHALQALNVAERVEVFFREHSEIANRVKIQDICSYLGTNRNALARLENGRRLILQQKSHKAGKLSP